MPATIGDNFVQEFNNSLDVIARNQTPKLLQTVTLDQTGAEFKYYDRLGDIGVPKKKSRYSDTEWEDPAHSRRRVQPEDYIQHIPLDHSDKLRLAISPESDYAAALVRGMNKAIDLEIVRAATGTVYAGKSGTTQVTFPASQQVAVNFVESGSPTPSNLTIGKLRRARLLLDQQEAVMDGEPQFLILSASQMNSLLRTTEVTSADYNTVRALVNGSLDTFMGFKFVVSQQLNKTGNNRSVLAYPKSAIKFCWLDPVKGRIAERADKDYTLQISIMASFGAVRMWEEKVVEILCDETK
jgi:hypothetical protein